MKRSRVSPAYASRFGVSHPHRLNVNVGYRGGIRN